MKLKFAILFLLFLHISMFSEHEPVIPHVDPSLRFTENKGQWDAFIRYRVQLDGGMLYMKNDGLTYDFYDKRKYRAMHLGKVNAKDGYVKAHAFNVEFLGCNKNSINEASEQGTDYENFYLGNDKKKWKGDVKNYHHVFYRSIYPNIDYEAITSTEGLKYNFYVKPGSDPELIKMKYTGVERMRVKNGELIIPTTIDSVIERKPYAYQRIGGQIKEVPCRYRLKNNVVAFDFPEGYDKAYELVIDPVLVFAAQSGSLADNFGMTATYDNTGNLISGGTAFGNGYPTTVGAYCITFTGVIPSTPYLMYVHGRTDVVVTKYNATGTNLIFSTYLGGDSTEIVTSLIVDQSNNVFLYGATNSPNFPTTAGSYDQTFNGGGSSFAFPQNGTVYNGGTDIYVAKFNSTATSLLGSTFIGGSDNDGVNYPLGSTTAPDTLMHNYGDQYRGEIQLDKFGNIYIASSTRSSNFPMVGAFDNTLGGYQDAVIFKFNNSLSSLLWSTYFGGSRVDAGYSIIVTDSMYIYVTGGTASSNLASTPGFVGDKTAFSGGDCDGYIIKINPSGSAVLRGTYVGTTSYDQTYFIQQDANAQIYVYGQSLGNMPVVGAVYNNPGKHMFITRYGSMLTSINLSTVFGGNPGKPDISPSAFLVDICGNIYTSGWGGDINTGPALFGMPITTGALYSTPPSGYDFHLMALYPNMSGLYYGTYFGGNVSMEHVDGGTSRFNKKGVIYQSVCAGCQTTANVVNQDFPVTSGAWPGTPGTPNHNNQNKNCNNGVFKLDFQLKTLISSINTNTISGCSPLTVNFTNTSSTYTGTTFMWYFGPGNTNTTTANPVQTFTAPGTYTVTLLVTDTSACNKKDSSIIYITVVPGIKADFSYTVVPCSDSIKYTNLSIPTPTSVLQTLNWNFIGIGTSTVTNPTQTVSASGNYTTQLVVMNNFGCKDSIKKVLPVVIFNPTIIKPDTICFGEKPVISAGGGTSYTWSPTGTLNNPNAANPIASPTVTTIYTVMITNTVSGCSKTLTTQITVNPKPNADYTYTVNKCGGGVSFTDQSVSGITQWNWNFGDSHNSIVQNAYNFYSTGGTYSVTLIVKNAFGCADTILKPITVANPPPVSVSASVTVCDGNTAQLNATGGIAYSWSPASSLNNSTIANPIASPSASTQYSVIISTINTNTLFPNDTCKFTLVTAVNVNTLSVIPISADANPDTVVKGNSSVLTLYASPGALVTWYPINSTAPVYGYTVTATPPRTTTYTVTISRGPCTKTLQVTVYVIEDGCDENDVFVPNTFTPNGDGENDIMYARGGKLSEVYFAIYNRWGEMVFETNDKTIGWDGIYKGRPADVGVFGYYVKAKCANGLKTFKKGNITLIR